MYRVWMASIPVMSDLYFGGRMFFEEEGMDPRRENAMRPSDAPKRRVSAETESRDMVGVAVFPTPICVSNCVRA